MEISYFSSLMLHIVEPHRNPISRYQLFTHYVCRDVCYIASFVILLFFSLCRESTLVIVCLLVIYEK